MTVAWQVQSQLATLVQDVRRSSHSKFVLFCHSEICKSCVVVVQHSLTSSHQRLEAQLQNARGGRGGLEPPPVGCAPDESEKGSTFHAAWRKHVVSDRTDAGTCHERRLSIALAILSVHPKTVTAFS